MAEMVSIDLELHIRQAVENMNVEIERRAAFKIARELRKLGWVCIPPASVTHPTHASDPTQVGTTGRLDVKTAQTGAQHSNERNEK